MPDPVKINMAEFRVGSNPSVFMCVGLGSCVGIVLYDRLSKVGAMAHIMLPNSSCSKDMSNKAKFADTAIDEMIGEMEKKGANRKSISVALISEGKPPAGSAPVSGAASFYVHPLVFGSSHFGYFCLIGREPDYFDREDTKFFDTLGNQLTLFIEDDRMKESIVRANAELRKRTEELTILNRQLEEFSYTISHDLKEPVRAMESFGKFLEEDYGSKIGKKGRIYIDRVRAGSKRIKRMINDLLELSRIGRDGYATEEVDVGRLISEAKEDIGAGKKAKVTIAADFPIARGNALRISQLFRNLLSNAVKFNDSARPEVTVGWMEARGETAGKERPEAIFFVKDNGIGIDKKDHEWVFQIFQRLNSGDKYEGTGAGLTICNRIVEEHGGKIWLESERGKGTAFYFTLPVVKQ